MCVKDADRYCANANSKYCKLCFEISIFPYFFRATGLDDFNLKGWHETEYEKILKIKEEKINEAMLCELFD